MKLKVMYDATHLNDFEIKEEVETSTVDSTKKYNTKRVYFKHPTLSTTVVKATIHNDIPEIGEYFRVPNPYTPEDCPEGFGRVSSLFWSLPEAILGLKAGYGDCIVSRRGMFSIEMHSDNIYILDRDIAEKKHQKSMKDWGVLDVDLDDVGYKVSVGFGFSSSPIVKILSDEELLKETKDMFKSEEEYQEKWNSYSQADKDDFNMERYVRGNSFEFQHPFTFKTYEEMQKVRDEFERVYRGVKSHDYTGSSWGIYSPKLIDTMKSLEENKNESI